MSEELEVTVLFVGNCHLTKARDRAQTDSFCRDVAILAKVQQSLKFPPLTIQISKPPIG